MLHVPSQSLSDHFAQAGLALVLPGRKGLKPPGGPFPSPLLMPCNASHIFFHLLTLFVVHLSRRDSRRSQYM